MRNHVLVPALLGVALAALTSSAVAQAPLRSPHLSLYPETSFYDFKVADLGDDAAPDLVFTTVFGGVLEADGDGLGGILPTTVVSPQPSLSLATGDLNGDGRDDCAFLLLAGSQVIVRLNLGAGAWAAGPVLETYTKPSTVVIADLDADGLLDVLAGEHGIERLQWFRNLGLAQFAEPVDLPCAKDSLALAVGDVDGNGWPDVASASDVLGDASVMITRADGAGGFLDAETLAEDIVLQPGDTLLIDDLDADGLNDVLLAAGEPGVAVFTGALGLPPRPPYFVPTPMPAQSLATGDLDGDGDTDLSVGQHGGLVSNFLAENGVLVETRQFAAAVGPVFEHVTDFDLDGNLDVITGNGQFLTPLMGRGHGDFRPCYGFESLPLDLAASDHDLDGFSDALVLLTDGSAHLLSGSADGALGRDEPVDLGAAPVRAFFAQADEDQWPDLVALQTNGNDGVDIALATGLGDYLPPVHLALPAQVRGGAVGLLNEDHLSDIVVLRSLGTDNSAIVLLATGGGGYATSDTLLLSTRPVDVEIADMNGDTQPDLVLLEEGALNIFPGDGTGHFGAALPAAASTDVLDLLVRDFDGDGLMDTAVARKLNSEVQFRYGNGDGTLQPPVAVDVRVMPTGLEAGDFDLDGGLDVLITGLADAQLPGSVAILSSAHDGGFEDVKLVASSADAGKPVAADVDGDGKLDAALLIPDGLQLDLYLNAAPTWQPLGHSLAGSAGYSVLVGAGSLMPESAVELLVGGAAPLAPAFVLAGFESAYVPFKGGVLVPQPSVELGGFATDAGGDLSLTGSWPAGVPSGTQLVVQVWMLDAGGPQGLSATTAVSATAP